MADKITIEYTGADILAALSRLYMGVGPEGMRGALEKIGEDLAESTKRRFVTSTAPDGSRWAPNAQTTYLGLLGEKDTRKDGRINAKGTAKVAGKKPLVKSRELADSISYQLMPGGAGVEVGSNRIYAGTQQFGAKQGQYGKSKRGGPIPWGDIPARPFLGLSAQDEENIMSILTRHLSRLTAG